MEDTLCMTNLNPRRQGLQKAARLKWNDQISADGCDLTSASSARSRFLTTKETKLVIEDDGWPQAVCIVPRLQGHEFQPRLVDCRWQT